MAEKYAPEFETPELSRSYLDSLLGGIDDQSRVDEGRALAEQAARGTLGQQTADSAVGAVRAGVARDKSRTIGEFNLGVADRRREERLGEKGRGWNVEDRNFGAAEAEKSRAFQEKMAQLGYMYGDASARRDSNMDFGGFLTGIAAPIAAAGVGGYMARPRAPGVK